MYINENKKKGTKKGIIFIVLLCLVVACVKNIGIRGNKAEDKDAVKNDFAEDLTSDNIDVDIDGEDKGSIYQNSNTSEAGRVVEGVDITGVQSIEDVDAKVQELLEAFRNGDIQKIKSMSYTVSEADPFINLTEDEEQKLSKVFKVIYKDIVYDFSMERNKNLNTREQLEQIQNYEAMDSDNSGVFSTWFCAIATKNLESIGSRIPKYFVDTGTKLGDLQGSDISTYVNIVDYTLKDTPNVYIDGLSYSINKEGTISFCIDSLIGDINFLNSIKQSDSYEMVVYALESTNLGLQDIERVGVSDIYVALRDMENNESEQVTDKEIEVLKTLEQYVENVDYIGGYEYLKQQVESGVLNDIDVSDLDYIKEHIKTFDEKLDVIKENYAKATKDDSNIGNIEYKIVRPGLEIDGVSTAGMEQLNKHIFIYQRSYGTLFPKEIKKFLSDNNAYTKTYVINMSTLDKRFIGNYYIVLGITPLYAYTLDLSDEYE